MKKKIITAKIFSLIVLTLFLGIFSCKKEKFTPNSIGKEVLSEDDLLNLNTIDTVITIYSYPVLADSVKTDEVSSEMLLGSYVDPVFGLSLIHI